MDSPNRLIKSSLNHPKGMRMHGSESGRGEIDAKSGFWSKCNRKDSVRAGDRRFQVEKIGRPAQETHRTSYMVLIVSCARIEWWETVHPTKRNRQVGHRFLTSARRTGKSGANMDQAISRTQCRLPKAGDRLAMVQEIVDCGMPIGARCDHDRFLLK